MDRRQAIDSLRSGETWDILILGGGATGLGAAVDAASRGYRTALVEQHDFAKGTSSRSTKLVHGGVRYLEQFQWRLVFEALRERNLLLRNAPHLAAWQAFVVPAYAWHEQGYVWAGLKLYGALAGRGAHARSRWLGHRAVMSEMPTLRSQLHTAAGRLRQLRGGIRYLDGQFDDARLAITLARTAAEHGAVLANYVRVVRIVHRSGRVTGAVVRDEESGDEWEVAARSVVNATGIFADAVRELDDSTSEPLLTYSQGVHLVVDASVLGGSSALVVPRTDDGRVLFAIPWSGKVLIGTTDTPIAEPMIEPAALPAEIEFLRRHASQYLDIDLRPADIRSIFVGIRPLLRGKAETQTRRLSRSHAVIVSPSGLVTVTGGKWTTYRYMAETTIHRASEIAALTPRACRTKELLLHGAPRAADVSDPLLGSFAGHPPRGTEAADVERLVTEMPAYREPLAPGLPYRIVDVVWAARHEMARTVEDVLARRTRALLLDARASLEAAPLVARYLAQELGRDEAWQRNQVRDYGGLAQRYLPPESR